MTKYTIELKVQVDKDKPIMYKETIRMNYTNENFLLCEGALRDIVKEFMHKFIEKEFY